jgi:two-component system sensor histidine kinase ChiS
MDNREKPIILCVDDERIVLDSLREQLSRDFNDEVEIEVAESGDAALELLETLLKSNLEIALVISDQLMPGMKGDDFLVEVHRRSPKTLTILLTGQASPEAVGHSLNEAGLYRFIPKPWNKQDLSLTIKEAIRSYVLDRALEEKHDELQAKNASLAAAIAALYKFVPHQFLEILDLHSEDYVKLGACSNRTISILFSAIQFFSTVTEGKTAFEIFQFINNHYAVIGPIITAHHGFIDKFIGNAIMAIFLDPDDALKAGIEMQQAMKGKSYSISVGINTGETIMGTVGVPDRLQTTVLGDTVNMASGVEALNRVYGTNLIITENTLNSLKNKSLYSFRKIDRIKLTDRSSHTTIFEVTESSPQTGLFASLMSHWRS